MAIITGDFSITRGDTHVQSWALVDSSGVAVDITGGKFYCTLKNAVADADPGVLQLTSPSSGITIDNAAGGLATLTITAAQTAALAIQTYEYDVQYKDSAGTITTLARGKMTVTSDVTITTA